ncbi:hypothetical protein JWG44_21890 [Leptospira sp. 201903071]|uniref:hypothetical protein n=1 Tax=Leptospira ainazelensis TaxID=2810034 RepID=UPI001963A8D6|nr:hypothetical protein [Leptospira ainazelensis]MBM9502908.1 hypothetical protein [Leptospira ainazelensis]
MQTLQRLKTKVRNIFQDYFKGTKEDIAENQPGFLSRVLIGQLLLILLYVIGNLIVTYTVNYSEVSALNVRMKLLFEQRGISPFLYSMNTYPFSILWAVFFILLYQFFSIITKFGILKTFSEKDVSITSLAAIEITSFSRFILCLFPILLYAELFPEKYKQELLPLLFYSSIYLITLLYGVYLYAVRYVKLSKELYSQAVGRTIFTFSTPITTIVLMILGIIR